MEATSKQLLYNSKATFRQLREAGDNFNTTNQLTSPYFDYLSVRGQPQLDNLKTFLDQLLDNNETTGATCDNFGTSSHNYEANLRQP